jgi:hypothetical protein
VSRVGATGASPAEAPPPYRIEPGEIDVELTRGGRQFVALDAAGVDLTHLVRWSVGPEDVAFLEASGYVRPRRPGRATLRVEGDAGRVERPIALAAPRDPAPDFASQVVPILTKQGCNTGGCHARAGGQNGFHLSLFGYDLEGDHQALTREGGGRRIDLLRPASSLLLQKATGRIPHGGGLRVAPGSEAERLLLDWIAAGAPGPGPGAPPRERGSVVVAPAVAVRSRPGPLQLRVVVRETAGHERDVTRWAVYRTNDDRVATVDERGRVDLLAPGETDIVVRFGPSVVTARVAVPRPGPSATLPRSPSQGLIDREIFARLAALNVPASPPASDAAFLRRVSLDLTGQTPEPDEVRAFLADPSPDKRTRKVDALMARPEFLDFWALKLGDLLQITRARLGDGAGGYQRWLQSRLRDNTPWDVMVREMLTALGDPLDPVEGGPVNYALDGATPTDQAELAARRFLGLRLRCAQCHDHPFDVWTQDDYYGLAAFFAKVDRGGSAPPGMAMRTRVTLNPNGLVNHLRTGQPAAPRLLDGSEPAIPDGGDPRRALADWITSPENPKFARAAVNWTWAQLFGRGLVDPPDDMSAANPPVHPRVLDGLAQAFAEHEYDLRWLIREIATSDVYGLSAEPVPGNEQDARLFSRHLPRPLTAHQMADALARATQVPNVFKPGQKVQPRAIEVFDPATPSAILDAFGRCSRVETCSTVGAPQVTLRQALLLIGGDAIDGKVGHLNGYLAHALELDPEPDELVTFLYVRALARPPSDEERSHWARVLADGPSLRETAEDLFWALLNSREFAFNH